MNGLSGSGWGKWQTIFFREGPAKAMDYCDQVIESLDKTRELFEEIIGRAVGNEELVEVAEGGCMHCASKGRAATRRIFFWETRYS